MRPSVSLSVSVKSQCEFEFESEDIFFLNTPDLTLTLSLVVRLWRTIPVTVFNQVKIKKCELEAECEVNPHTQSTHSHC